MRRLLTARLIQRHRRRARILLYLVPLALVGTGWGVVAISRHGLERPWLHVDYAQDEAVRIFQRYLRIDTSYPTGNEIPGAELLARELEKDGIEAHVERLGHRNANLWAILEGEDPRALVLHNHIDVDPIHHLEAWLHPPLSGMIELPFIHGRGAFDMKSLTVAQLMAVKELQRDGRPLRRSLVFLATGDEERDSWHGARWVLRQHPELVERFDVVLTEGGAVEATDVDEVKYWGTEVRQKLYVEMQVCSDNLGALEGLREDLAYPDRDRRGHPDELPRRLVEELRTYVTTRERADFQLFFDSALFWRGGFSRLPFNVQSMMRHDLAVFPVEADPHGGGYRMRLILRLLPWEPIGEAVATLLPDGLPGFATTAEIPHGPIPLAGLDHPLYDLIGHHVQKSYPGFVHGPLFLPWAATDARFFRAAGIPAYGFSPFLILTGDAAKITGPNERMVAPAFVEGVELYRRIVTDWVRGSDS